MKIDYYFFIIICKYKNLVTVEYKHLIKYENNSAVFTGNWAIIINVINYKDYLKCLEN